MNTIQDIIGTADTYRALLALGLCSPPVLTVITGLLHAKETGGTAPWKYFYAVLVYAAVVPGMFSTVLVADAMLFTRESLLNVSLTVYFLPIITMAVTLLVMRRKVNFDDVPGFDRLTGLLVMVGLAFAIVFALSRTGIWFVFGAPLVTFFSWSSEAIPSSLSST